MKKILIFSFVFILLIVNVQASALSALWKQGISAANPEAAKVISAADRIMEIQSLAQCATGLGAAVCAEQIITQKAMGQVYGEAIKAADPEIQKIISVYQQLDLYKQAGAEIIGELKVNENGEIESGIIQFNSEKESEIGNLIGPDLEVKDFIVNGVEIEKQGDTTKITFVDDKKGKVCAKGVCFENIQSQSTAKHPTYIEIDKEGNIVKADFTTGEGGGTYTLGGSTFEVPGNSRVEYGIWSKIPQVSCREGAEIKKAPKGEVTYEGKNIKLPDEVNIKNGIVKIKKEGYLVQSGEVIYKQNFFEVFRQNDEVLIVTDPHKDMSNYEGHWIRQTKEKLVIQSSKTAGDIKIDFLENHEILNINKYDKLSVLILGGDGLIFEKRDKNIPLVKHQSVGFTDSNSAYTEIHNDGLVLAFSEGKKLVKYEELTLDTIRLGKYQAVAFELEPDSQSIGGKLKINSNSQISMFSKDEKERVIFKTQGLSKLLQEGLTEEQINERIKEIEKVSGEYATIVVEDYLPAALQAGLSSDQTTKLIEDILKEGHRPISILSVDLPATLQAASWAGLSSDQTTKLIKEVMKKFPEDLSSSLNTNLPKTLREISYSGLSSDQIMELMTETMEVSKTTDSLTGNLLVSLKEFDGTNFEDVLKGAVTTTKYLPYYKFSNLASDLDIKYVNIQDKESLAKEYDRALKSYLKGNPNPDASTMQRAAVVLNTIHNNEGVLEGKDTMREYITKELMDFETRYIMIAEANPDLYQSSFRLIYDNLPKDLVKEIKNKDPLGKHQVDFLIQIAERDELNNFLAQDPNFFRDVIDKGISNLEIETLVLSPYGGYESIGKEPLQLETTASLANTFIEFYENPKYSNEKDFFEKKLIDLYKNADSLDDKASYAYLIKLNEKSSNNEFKQIYESLPELPEVIVPKYAGEVYTAKQYFYPDENWFEITKNDYINPNGIYKFNIVEETKDTTILEKKIENGKTLKMILTKDNSDASDVLKDDETILVVHRGHSYNSIETFEGSSNKEKIIIDGGCGGPGRVLEIQRKYPNSQVIYDKDKGEGAINQYEAYKVLRRVALGETNWDEIRDKTEGEQGIILPNDKNQLLLKYKDLIENM
ncbi:MAG: hypothetical protein L6266_01865 [Nanoarchaeota archaeon]|nr:hypothetical protein [Nanoarchaeota archaeon]